MTGVAHPNPFFGDARRPQRTAVIALAALAWAFTLAPGPAAGQSAKSSLQNPEQAEFFNEISDKLVCQCGCNSILRVCNHYECPSAVPMRKEIEKQILAGVAEADILASFVEEYGQVVRATPPASGINLAAWVMPGLAVLLGAFALFYFLSSVATKKKTAPVPAEQRLDPAVTERIEKELKGLDS